MADADEEAEEAVAPGDRGLGARDALLTEMHKTARTLRIGTRNYGVTYYLSRILLICLSSVVAAGANLADSKGNWMVIWIPVLAVVVAAMTALDTWLKPQQKWQDFMESRDALALLVIDFRHGLPFEEAHLRFSDLREQHRTRNIF
ncbi:DUF4231 domain-containing protein [Streptomyces sp. col6]|uniref:DUF4231 domain-containing protein n=1 Tax=Streptomyces sp. col6 TaxID=2478958 RepID=UPI0011CD97DB|nr:DUF4231 domain-containing protein [Streptomyces sp. col6]TXS04772.1 DUF4231 domain-containing protein [Streptomyces sp. col6]